MGSKIWLLLGLSVASALFISSEVAARNLAEFTSNNAADGGSLDSASDYHVGGSCSNSGGGRHHGGGGCYHGGGRRCNHYCHGRCCSAAEAQALEATQVKPRN